MAKKTKRTSKWGGDFMKSVGKVLNKLNEEHTFDKLIKKSKRRKK